MTVLSLLELAGRLADAQIAEREATEIIVREAAKMLARSAKDSIGTYDFGWPELTPSTQADRVRQGFSPDEPLLRTGALKDSISWNADGREAYVGTNNEHAAYSEFGTVHEPPRSYLGGAIQHEAGAIRAMAARITAAAIAGALGGKSELFEVLREAAHAAKETLHEARDTMEDEP